MLERYFATNGFSFKVTAYTRMDGSKMIKNKSKVERDLWKEGGYLKRALYPSTDGS